MKRIYVFNSKNPNKIEIEPAKLEEMLEEAFQDGYNMGKGYNYYPIWTTTTYPDKKNWMDYGVSIDCNDPNTKITFNEPKVTNPGGVEHVVRNDKQIRC